MVGMRERKGITTTQMSIELVRHEIYRFLASPEAEVLCLRGKWGVGKTFSWRAFLLEAKDRGSIALKSYSYVSLFGIESLDQLKYAIFANSVGLDAIGVEPSLETFKSNTAAISEQLGRRWLPSVLEAFLGKSISAKAREALVQIGKESPINRRRVRKFGVQVEEEPAVEVLEHVPPLRPSRRPRRRRGLRPGARAENATIVGVSSRREAASARQHSHCFASEGWWAREGSNLQPDGYEPPALTS
jgi:hypothetical protein